MTVLTSNQLNIVRSPNQSTDLFLSVYQPTTVFTARINDASIIKGATSITYDGIGITDSWADIKSGMTLYIGTSAGAYDVGRIRIKSATSTILTVARDDAIKYEDNLYLTVVNKYDLWGVFPLAVLGANNSVTFYKDDTIAYSNQNEVFEPVVLMGGDYAGFGTPTGGYSVYFTATGSYIIDGSTMSTYAWSFPSGCVPQTYNGITPGYVAFPSGGHYAVECLATATSGKTRTSYRHISLYDRLGQSANIPILDWELDDISGDFDNGWSAKIKVGNDANKFVDDALVIIFADDYYNNNLGSYGGFIGREHIVFVGYVNKADTYYDFQTSKTTFYLKGISGLLDNREMFSVSLEHSASPANWTQLKNMSINKILYHYLNWHTTLLNIADYTKIQTAHGDYPEQFEDITKGQVLDNINNLLNARLFSKFVSDKQGRCFAEVNLNYLPTGSRPSANMSFQAGDWVDKIEFSEIIDTPIASTLLGGVSFDTVTVSGTALLARAPGNDPTYKGKYETISGLSLNNQSQLNELAMLHFANVNNRYKKIEMTLANNMRHIDIIPQEYFNITLNSTDTFRNITWNPKRIIPRTIRYNHKNGWLQQNIVFEGETINTDVADTVIIPVTPPNTRRTRPTRRIKPPPSPGSGTTKTNSSTGSSLVYVVTDSKIARTRNFTNVSPTWNDITGSLVGNSFIDFVLDPFDPKNIALVMSASKVWRTTNLDATSPTWTLILSNTTISSDIGLPADETFFRRLRSNITVNGGYYLMFHTPRSGPPAVCGIVKTTNNYTTRAICTYSSSQNNSLITQGFDVGQHNFDVVAVSHRMGGDVLKGYDITYNGCSFTVRADVGYVYAIHFPYDNNLNDSTIYFAIDSAIYKSTDSGANITNITPPGYISSSGWGTVHSYTQNKDIIFVADNTKFFFSINAGLTWEQRSTYASSTAFGGFPYNSGVIYRIENSAAPKCQ